jgi:hypothetical protein
VREVLQPLCVGPLPRGGPGVVIDVVDPAPGVPAHLPAGGQRLRPLPRRAARVVVHVVAPPVRVEPEEEEDTWSVWKQVMPTLEMHEALRHLAFAANIRTHLARK